MAENTVKRVFCKRTQWKEQTIYGVFRKPLFKHRYEADQQSSPGSPIQKLTILECKNHKDVEKSCNFLVEQWAAFKKGETFGWWNVDWQLEENESVAYVEICSGVTPAVVATVYKLKLLKNSRKDNFFSQKVWVISIITYTSH